MKNSIKIMQSQLVMQSNYEDMINKPLKFQERDWEQKRKKHKVSLLVAFYFVV